MKSKSPENGFDEPTRLSQQFNKLEHETINHSIINESVENDFDYAVLKIGELEYEGRFQFTIRPIKYELVGEQVLFFGFPFGFQHLTSHVGYVSAEFYAGSVHLLQIDGSINPGNSGGPLVKISSGDVIGIVTKTQTGLEKDFDQLQKAIEQNINDLERSRQEGRIIMMGLDPIKATQATMEILRRIAKNLKRSANVGIGYAYSTEHILETGLFS